MGAIILTLKIKKEAMKQIQKIIDRNPDLNTVEDVIRESLFTLAKISLAKSKGYVVAIVPPSVAKKLNIVHRI